MADTEAEVEQAQTPPAPTQPDQPDPADAAPADPVSPDTEAADSDPAPADTLSASTAADTAADTAAATSTAVAAADPVPAAPAAGAIHHIELWVPDLDRAIVSWGWLLGALGYRLYQDWPGGRSWGAGHSYIVVEQSPARTAGRHDRCRPGMNHLAFFAADRKHVDELVAEALLHGWRLMFTDLHPYAGGEHHYAAYLENADGFEIELVAGAR
jgi:catechol 2,3-dioxygenase-like lactoylglutathione lyase family enzyme